MCIVRAFQLNHEIPTRWKSHACTFFPKPGPLVTTNWWPGCPGPTAEDIVAIQGLRAAGDLMSKKPVIPVQRHLMNQAPHPAAVGRPRRPPGPLSTRRVCATSVSHLGPITQPMTGSRRRIPHNRVLRVKERDGIGNDLRLLLLT